MWLLFWLLTLIVNFLVCLKKCAMSLDLNFGFYLVATTNVILFKIPQVFYKNQTSVGQERGTHLSFIENYKTSQYAWNSAPIDDTDIPRSLAAVDLHFKLPMDIDLNATPTIN